MLEFTVTNEGLKNKTEIVKTLLKYGADPDPLKHDALGNDDEQAGGSEQSLDLVKKIEENMNPALKWVFGMNLHLFCLPFNIDIFSTARSLWM